MPHILIRDVPREIVDELKSRAAAKRRSLQQELHSILEETVNPDYLKGIQLAEEIRSKMVGTGRDFSDSTELIRDDRSR